jgi:hypothetical protein
MKLLRPRLKKFRYEKPLLKRNLLFQKKRKLQKRGPRKRLLMQRKKLTLKKKRTRRIRILQKRRRKTDPIPEMNFMKG